MTPRRSALVLVVTVALLLQPVGGAVGSVPTDGASGDVTATPAQVTPSATVTAANATVPGPAEVGDTVTVNVTVSTTASVYGAQATLGYDAAALDVVNVSSGDFLSDGAATTANWTVADGSVDYWETRLRDGNTTNGTVGDGTLFTVTFRVTEAVTGPATLSELGLSEVVLSDETETAVDTSTTDGSVTVGDGTAPVARLTVPEEAVVDVPFLADASASTDAGRIVNYSFAVNGDQRVRTGNATAQLNISTTGEHTVSVTVTDAAGNSNTTAKTLTVRPGADLRTRIDAPASQRIDDGVVANVTMRNVGSGPAGNATLRLDAAGTYWSRDHESTSVAWNVSLGSNESVTKTANLTEWVREELDPYSFDSGRISLVARADPGDSVTETNEENNRATARTVATFTEFSVYVRAPDRLANQSRPVTVYVRNYGSATSDNRTVNVSFGDGATTSFVTPSLDPGRSYETELGHAYNETGDYELTATVGDERDVEYLDVVEFDVDADLYAPDTVEAGSGFRVYADYHTNAPANASVTLDTPAALTTDDPAERTYEDAEGAWTSWWVTAPRGTAGPPRSLNVTVEARNETANASTDVTVEVPTVRVRDSASVTLRNDTTSGTGTIEVRNETTFEHDLSLSVQAGPEGRTLDGLQYLFTYPYGCVEQTTSPLLAALYTDQYYRAEGRTPPDGYNRDRTNRSILGGVKRLAPGSSVGQHETGAWSMWGGDPSGDMFYTAYAFRGMTAVRNDPVQGERPQVRELAANATDFNETVVWLRDRQATDGSLPSDGYFLDNDASMTGFVTISLSQAGPFNESADAMADQLRRNATQFLLNQQRDDGSWGDARTTALALWGLHSAAESGALNATVTNETDAAIDDAVAALVAAQESDGGWPGAGSVYWDSTGRDSMATGYSLLALNATGLSAENETLAAGVRNLVGVYETGGSWGDTESSAVAIQALQTLGQGLDDVNREVTVEVDDDDGAITKTAVVNATSKTATVNFTDAELARLRNGSVEKSFTVNSTGLGATVVALENNQLVNRTAYEMGQTGTGSVQSAGVTTLSGSTQLGTTAVTEPAPGSPAPFTASIAAAGTPTTRDSTIAVTVENTANDTLLNPIVEVPVVGAMNATGASAHTVVDGTRESLTLTRNNSSFTGGESLSIFGREVPANDERTYYLNVSTDSPGELAVEADVRPLYNESLNARPNTTVSVRSVGSLRVSVANATGAEVSLGGTDAALDNGTTEATLPAGTVNVSADAPGALDLPELSVRVPQFGTLNVSYAPAARYPDPTAVARVGDANVLAGSVSRLTEREPSAETVGERSVSFTVADTEGPAVVAFETPAGYNRTNVSLSGDVASHSVSRSGNLTVLRLNATGDVDVSVDYRGFVLGDLNGDGGVTTTDAAAIADLALAGDRDSIAADVNGDGRVTVVDAMFAAQYANGARGADYGLLGGGA